MTRYHYCESFPYIPHCWEERAMCLAIQIWKVFTSLHKEWRDEKVQVTNVKSFLVIFDSYQKVQAKNAWLGFPWLKYWHSKLSFLGPLEPGPTTMPTFIIFGFTDLRYFMFRDFFEALKCENTLQSVNWTVCNALLVVVGYQFLYVFNIEKWYRYLNIAIYKCVLMPLCFNSSFQEFSIQFSGKSGEQSTRKRRDEGIKKHLTVARMWQLKWEEKVSTRWCFGNFGIFSNQCTIHTITNNFSSSVRIFFSGNVFYEEQPRRWALNKTLLICLTSNYLSV